jgi:polyhydroxybutyrate depolymerase
MENKVDDVAFIRAMVQKIDRDFGIDRSRIYATGMSNGAMMSYRLGCEAADLFAAIGPVAGALNIPCRPSDEVAVIIFHGTEDLHVPYEGGTGPKSLVERVDRPVSHAVSTWSAANGCSRETRKTTRGSVIKQSWTGCREGTEVTLYTIEGGGHSWPGGVEPRRSWADPPTQEISASEELWKFFAAHPKR